LPDKYAETRVASLGKKAPKPSSSRELTPISKTDPADYVKELVLSYIFSTYGWSPPLTPTGCQSLNSRSDVVMKCALEEPIAVANDEQRSVGFNSSDSICVDAATIRQLLSASAAEFVVRVSPVNVSYIETLANDILSQIPSHKGYITVQDLATLNIPLDRLSVLLSALALCCIYPKRIDNNASAYFSASSYLLNKCATEPSLDVCIASYLQHLYILKTGPDNQHTSALTMAIRTAHALKINDRESVDHDTLPAKLYLFIYFQDQWVSLCTYIGQRHRTKFTNTRCCAMSNNTPPLIRTTDYSASAFDHVLEEEPDFRPLFDILVANGQVLEALYGQPCNYTNIYHLEELLGCVSKSARKPMQPFLGLNGFNMNYEAPVQIHMFWYVHSTLLFVAPYPPIPRLSSDHF
jgi:hypothetical protein